MAARGSVRLGVSLWSKRQRTDASAISLCTVSPLGNKPIPPGRRCFSACREQLGERRQGAGRDHVRRLRRQRLDRARRAPSTGRPRLARRRREERGLARSLSTSRTRRSGACSAASAATTRPGKPAPEPRSSQSARAGRPQRPELRGVGDVPASRPRRASTAATRLIRGFQLCEQRDDGSRAASSVSRETSKARRNASAVAHEAARAPRAAAPAAGPGSAPPGSSPRSAPPAPAVAGRTAPSLSRSSLREPGDAGVVDAGGDRHRLVAAQPRHVLRLPLEVGRVARVALELGEDRRDPPPPAPGRRARTASSPISG